MFRRADRGPPNFRTVTLVYALALGLIAAMMVGTHILIDAIIVNQADTARVVNMAGRQRMLSQRIAGLSLSLGYASSTAERDTLESDLRRNLREMEAAYIALSYGSDALGIPAAKSQAELAIYRGKAINLDAQVARYIAIGRALLDLAPDARASSPELREILTASRQPLLEALEAAVAQRQADSEAAISKLREILLITLAVMLATLVAEAMFVFRPLFRRLKKTQDQLLEAAMTDPMTSCRNRRYFMDTGTHEIERARRADTPLAVLMLDIDHFKVINDTWGHAVGDEAIKMIAHVLAEAIRASDVLGRVGGEEFALLLPDTTPEAAVMVAEKLRQRIADTAVKTKEVTFHLTVSIGVTTLNDSDAGIAVALDRADHALYEAKQAGRNKVMCISWMDGTHRMSCMDNNLGEIVLHPTGADGAERPSKDAAD